jgi:hypothetical protein
MEIYERIEARLIELEKRISRLEVYVLNDQKRIIDLERSYRTVADLERKLQRVSGGRW